MIEIKDPVATKDIIALHNEGLSPSEIADRLGATWPTVYGRLIRAGLTPHPILPSALTEDIIALHEEGLSPSEIAEKLDTTWKTVYGRLIRAGLTPRPAPLLVATEDIIALHKEGLSPSVIADRLDISRTAAYTRLLRAGFDPHPAPPGMPAEDIIALHKEGLSPSVIADRLGITYSAVYKRLQRLGLTPYPVESWLRRRGYDPMYVKLATERFQDILKLHYEGLSTRQIAEKLELDIATVHKRLRAEGLAPHPSPQEAESTLREIDEIIRLAKEGIPRYEIAKRIGSTWPLVAESLEKTDIKPVWPACGELTSWTLTLLPLLDEIKRAHPNTEPLVTKAEELEEELVDIKDATWTVEQSLPYAGKEAEKERWCVAPISQAASSGLEFIEPLKGCLSDLDIARLPRKIEQAETCVINICDRISGDVRRVAKPVSLHSSETVRVGIGDSVCDKISGS